MDADARGIVAAVLEALQTLDQILQHLGITPDVREYAAHWENAAPDVCETGGTPLLAGCSWLWSY